MVRFPTVDGIVSDKLLWPRSRYLRRANLPRSGGMEPARAVLVRFRAWRKERLPR